MRRFILPIFALAIALLVLSTPSMAQVSVGVAVSIAPPELPVYDQPACPDAGYMWVPGYWAWDDTDNDYYWVPGTWVEPPDAGLLWTPGYWGWGNGGYLWYDGYWGPTVGFYGGINYGFGYFGVGFVGGYWQGRDFFYNRNVMNVNVDVIHNVYTRQVDMRDANVARVSYNGGNGGITARPTSEEEAAARERRSGPVDAQNRNMQAARSNRDFRASVNHGNPAVAATARPAEFSGGGVVKTREAGQYNPPANAGAARGENNPNTARTDNNVNGNANAPRTYNDVRDLPANEKMPAPNTGDAKMDQKYQKQQDKLYQQQEKERQKLDQQQQKEHQQAAKQQANDAAKQQMEARHQQQTQALQQRQSSARQQMQQREAPRSAPAPESHAAPSGGERKP